MHRLAVARPVNPFLCRAGTARPGAARAAAVAATMAFAVLVASGARPAAAQPGADGNGLERHYVRHIGAETPTQPLTRPGAVAFGRDGTAYVVDQDQWRIVRFAVSGEVIGAWGGPGGGPGEFGPGCRIDHDGESFCGPTALAVGADGDVYAADPMNGRVQRFTAWGAFVSRICVLSPTTPGAAACAPGDDPAKGFAWGLAVLADGRIAVALRAGPIRVFDGAGAVLADWDVRAGDLAPYGDGLVAAQPSLGRAVVLDGRGAVVRTLGTSVYPGSLAPGQFGRCYGGSSPMGVPYYDTPCQPAGVASGPDGAIYAVDSYSGRFVHRFATDGTVSAVWIRDFGGPESSRGSIDHHRRVAVAPDGRFIVAGDGPGVAVAAPDGRWLGTWTADVLAQPGGGGLDEPVAVAPTDGGGVVVAEAARGRLAWFDRHGGPLRVGPAPAPDGDALVRPVALAPAPGGGVVVADAGTGLARLVDADGGLGQSWGVRRAKDDDLLRPVSLLPLGDGTCLVADNERGRIVRLREDGTAAEVWAAGIFAPQQIGSYKFQFEWSHRLEIVADGADVLVLEVPARRIVRLRRDGTVIETIALDPSIAEPRGLAVAQDGTLLVLDIAPARVVRLARDGRTLGDFGADVFGVLKHGEPEAIGVRPDGVVVVVTRKPAKADQGRVLTFAVDGTLLESIPFPIIFLSANAIDFRPDGTYLFAFNDPQLVALETDERTVIRRGWSVPETNSAEGTIDPRPYDVAAAEDGGLWIAVGGFRPAIYRLRPDGGIGRVWRRLSDAPGHVTSPSGVAVAAGPDGRTRVFVADAVGHRIARFAWDGTFEAEWRVGPGDVRLYKPHHLAAAPDGTLWVADTGNVRAVHYAQDGTVLGVVDRTITPAAGLKEPVGIAVAPDGSLRIADGITARVVAVSRDGRFLDAWGSDGPPGTGIVRAAGLAYGGDGTLWVADPWRSHVTALGTRPPAAWNVRIYRDGALLDGPAAAFSTATLDLDWHGLAPVVGAGATGFAVRAERRVGDWAGAHRLRVSAVGGVTVAAPLGMPPLVGSGRPWAFDGVRELGHEGGWLRVDFAASHTGPRLHVGTDVPFEAFFPTALRLGGGW